MECEHEVPVADVPAGVHCFRHVRVLRVVPWNHIPRKYVELRCHAARDVPGLTDVQRAELVLALPAEQTVSAELRGERTNFNSCLVWIEVPGNGAYVAEMSEDLFAAGAGNILVEMDCEEELPVPYLYDEMRCFWRVRVLRVASGCATAPPVMSPA
jgi:hypothetical protein